MKIKKLPIWLMGGLIFGITALVYLLGLFIFSIVYSFTDLNGLLSKIGILFLPIFDISDFWCRFFTKCVGGVCSCNAYIPAILMVLASFLVGSLVGWIVGKINKRK